MASSTNLTVSLWGYNNRYPTTTMSQSEEAVDSMENDDEDLPIHCAFFDKEIGVDLDMEFKLLEESGWVKDTAAAISSIITPKYSFLNTCEPEDPPELFEGSLGFDDVFINMDTIPRSVFLEDGYVYTTSMSECKSTNSPMIYPTMYDWEPSPEQNDSRLMGYGEENVRASDLELLQVYNVQQLSLTVIDSNSICSVSTENTVKFESEIHKGSASSREGAGEEVCCDHSCDDVQKPSHCQTPGDVGAESNHRSTSTYCARENVVKHESACIEILGSQEGSRAPVRITQSLEEPRHRRSFLSSMRKQLDRLFSRDVHTRSNRASNREFYV